VPIKDEYAADHPLPVFLSARTEEFELPRDSSLLRKASILVMGIGVIGIAMTFLLADPMRLFGEADVSAARPAADQSAPPAAPAQSFADAAPAATSALAAASAPQGRDDTSATPPPADQTQPQSGALLQQFQSWATTRETPDTQPPSDSQPQSSALLQQFQSWAPAQAEPVRPSRDAERQAAPARPEQDATPQIMQDDPAPVRPVHAHKKPHPLQNARAEVRPPKPAKPGALPKTAQARPPADARPPEQPQPAQSPSLLQTLGLTPRQQP
jgi:hypothetical protein